MRVRKQIKLKRQVIIMASQNGHGTQMAMDTRQRLFLNVRIVIVQIGKKRMEQ